MAKTKTATSDDPKVAPNTEAQTPTPADQTTVANTTQLPPPVEPPVKKPVDEYEALAKQYAKHYPDCNEFHITTDKQVFLSRDKNLAVLHQSSLKEEGKVQSFKVK